MTDNIKITSDLEVDYCDLLRLVDMDSKFTLRDVLNIAINSKIPIETFKEILQCNYIVDLWDEAYSMPFIDNGVIEYLELKFEVSRHTFRKEICDSSGWTFCGMGKKGVIPEDLTKNGIQVEDPENFRQGQAIEFSPMYELADYPIHFDRGIYFTNYDAKDVLKNDDIPVRPSITLTELLYAVFWELTFCGGTEDRDNKLQELKQTIKDFEKSKADGTLKLIPFEDVKKNLEAKFGKFDGEDSPTEEAGGKD